MKGKEAVEEEPVEIDCQAGIATPYQSESGTPTPRGAVETPAPVVRAVPAEVPPATRTTPAEPSVTRTSPAEVALPIPSTRTSPSAPGTTTTQYSVAQHPFFRMGHAMVEVITYVYTPSHAYPLQ